MDGIKHHPARELCQTFHDPTQKNMPPFSSG